MWKFARSDGFYHCFGFRVGTRHPKPGTRNPEPGTRNPEPGTQNPKPETRNPEPGTRNPEEVAYEVMPVTVDRPRFTIFGWFLTPGKLYKVNPKPETRNSEPET
jgi:hypothetical protein